MSKAEFLDYADPAVRQQVGEVLGKLAATAEAFAQIETPDYILREHGGLTMYTTKPYKAGEPRVTAILSMGNSAVELNKPSQTLAVVQGKVTQSNPPNTYARNAGIEVRSILLPDLTDPAEGFLRRLHIITSYQEGQKIPGIEFSLPEICIPRMVTSLEGLEADIEAMQRLFMGQTTPGEVRDQLLVGLLEAGRLPAGSLLGDLALRSLPPAST